MARGWPKPGGTAARPPPHGHGQGVGRAPDPLPNPTRQPELQRGKESKPCPPPQSKQGAAALSHRGRAPEITHTFLKSHHPTLRLQITHPNPAQRGRGSDSPGVMGRGAELGPLEGKEEGAAWPSPPPNFDPHIHDHRSTAAVDAGLPGRRMKIQQWRRCLHLATSL